MEIYCLRVKRTKAGTHFPFDRIYLVPHEHRQCIKQLFRYALVMPVDGALKGMLLQCPPEQYINRTFNRDDAENKASTPMEGSWAGLINSNQWVMAVPLLTRWASRNAPKYLIAKGWYSPRTIQRKRTARTLSRTSAVPDSPFPALTYLQTPEKNIRPVCILCPRYILHQNGECQIGEPVCFEALPLGIHNYFKEGLEAPEPTPNVREPEVEEITHGDLLEDDAGADRNTQQ